MIYFGTDLRSHGHYLWELTGGFYRSRIPYSEIPFDPYEYRDNPKGHTVFVQEKEYTALHITGSAVDTRSGSVSVFWVNGSFDKGEFIKLLKSNYTAMQLINAMPFDVEIEQEEG